jgi:hypothetical protein
MLIGQHWLITKLIDQQILMTKLDSSRHGFGGRRVPLFQRQPRAACSFRKKNPKNQEP